MPPVLDPVIKGNSNRSPRERPARQRHSAGASFTRRPPCPGQCMRTGGARRGGCVGRGGGEPGNLEICVSPEPRRFSGFHLFSFTRRLRAEPAGARHAGHAAFPRTRPARLRRALTAAHGAYDEFASCYQAGQRLALRVHREADPDRPRTACEFAPLHSTGHLRCSYRDRRVLS